MIASRAAGPAALSVQKVSKAFGAVAAVDGVDLELAAGTTTAIIGPNGAGKTTLLKMIAGVERPTTGVIALDDRQISGMGAAKASHAGVGYAHQVPQPFRGLSVRDNVRVGAVEHRIPRADEWVDEVLQLCGLAGKAHRPAKALQILDLKRLELARAVATKPSLLLLDEVCAGLTGSELDAVISLVDRIRTDGPTIVLVEHIEAVVAQLASRVVVLDWGKLIADGTPRGVAEDPQVREVYMGAGHTGEGPAHVPAFDDVAPEDKGRGLVLTDVRAGYGMIEAVHGVSLELRPGKISAILGANGAGKTTLANAISGVSVLRGGTITLDGVRVDRMRAHRRAAAGIAVVPEGRRILPALTVRENLLLSTGLGVRRPEIERRLDAVLETFPQLADLMIRRGGALSGGQQQMLAVGRALMSDPKCLVCDEVSLGLAPVVIDALYEGLQRVVARGVALAVIEQHVQRSLAIADIAYVIDRGAVSYAGDPAPLKDPRVLDDVYFGSATRQRNTA
ncbi:ATP-binding cassette domain-containing protein [Microbacterium ulmi]|uniref:ATP-binding cassette domain-containing protein n=1 Tax=Microbacterium ulmi TaxID=179095 RepID=A0A7Y2Q1R9_9MICO|nr:ATP-binding cassette domain-containing protein [Microbacterium ulmi]NII68975.1 ABC-type branched-subunit amino acid transport system ATPase component [Microbacterium ulmi]NNH03958.1 ATP-binding cassette domain-containing protein [Microbacterium ulmi]